MREETSDWLEPMLTEAEARGISTSDLMTQATMPAVEADSPTLDHLAGYMPEGATMRALDWVRFGQLLRSRLGWDDTYPAYPDFPEARNTP